MRCFVKTISTLLAIVGLETMGGCAPQNAQQIVQDRVARCGLSKAENQQKIAEVTARIERAYDCQSLAFTAYITAAQVSEQMCVETVMGPKKFKTRVFLYDELSSIWTLIGGRFEEYRPAYYASPATYAIQEIQDELDGPGSVNLDFGVEQYLCNLGGYYRTWVGKNSTRVKFFTKRIATGIWLGQEVLDNQPCDVIACLPNDDYAERTEVFYFRFDGLLAKRESIGPTESRPTPHVIRVSTYHNYRVNQVPESAWRFERSLP